VEGATREFNAKQTQLCKNLEGTTSIIGQYNSQFVTLMNQDLTAYKEKNNLLDENEHKKELYETLQDMWKVEKKKKKDEQKTNEWLIGEIQRLIDNMYNDNLKDFSNQTNGNIAKFWDEKSEDFKEVCIGVIHDSDALTTEQKAILSSVVLKKENMSTSGIAFNLRQIGAVRHKNFLFWERNAETFSAKKCGDALTQKFDEVVRERMVSSQQANNRQFRQWADILIRTLKGELCKFNSELREQEQQILKLNKDIAAKRECEHMLSGSKDYIDNLLKMQGGEGIG
jgi:hypothetical protein